MKLFILLSRSVLLSSSSSSDRNPTVRKAVLLEWNNLVVLVPVAVVVLAIKVIALVVVCLFPGFIQGVFFFIFISSLGNVTAHLLSLIMFVDG